MQHRKNSPVERELAIPYPSLHPRLLQFCQDLSSPGVFHPRERAAPNRICVTSQSQQKLPRGCIPYLGSMIITGGSNPLPIRAVNNACYLIGVTDQSQQKLPCFCIPNFCSLILAGCSETLAIRAKSNIPNWSTIVNNKHRM